MSAGRGRRYTVAMDVEALVARSAHSVASVAPALGNLRQLDAERGAAGRAIERGYFKPAEEECIRGWLARYLTARAGLLETIEELTPIATGEAGDVDEGSQVRSFAIGYTASCLLVQAARTFIYEFATHKLLQRKLNEGSARHRIPRKQYTRIYKSLTHPKTARRLAEAMRFADMRRADLEALAGEALLGPVIGSLKEAEESVRVGLGRYVQAHLGYRWHSWRRRRASATQQALFRIVEGFGRVIAEVDNPWHVPRVTERHRAALAEVLEPGDVIISRHDDALSNLFLPGYWPHAALHVGLPSVREAMAIEVDAERAARWAEPLRVLEAKKDGVRLRALDETLAIDAVAVLRPRLDREAIAEGLTRALRHEGKLYNFDFDFFTDDRLVCTEVVYRAYEGIGGIEFALTERNGRPTLSAEDIARMAVEGRGLEAVAVLGTPGLGDAVATGAGAREALAALREMEDV